MIVWGTRYPASVINNLAAAVMRHGARSPRIVLIAEQTPDGLRDGIVVRPFPVEFLDPALRGPGCQAKLAMFAAGVVPPDLPAVYVDLDTVVLGDLGRAVAAMPDADAILLIPSTLFRFGRVARWLWRVSGGRHYARGNSSLVAFHPARCGYVATRFHELRAAHPGDGFKPLRADERFVSWVAQRHVAVMPRDIAVKFPAEFMSRMPGLPLLRAALPWVRRRRARLAAVSLCGTAVKPETLIGLADGAVILDSKRRRLVWTAAATGQMKAKILAFYRGVVVTS